MEIIKNDQNSLKVIAAIKDGFICDDSLVDAIDQTLIEMDGFDFEQALMGIPEFGGPTLADFIAHIRHGYVTRVIKMLDEADETLQR